MTPLAPVRLRVEGSSGWLGVAHRQPGLSWVLPAIGYDVVQTAAHIQVAHDSNFTDLVADTGMIDGDRSVAVPWPAPPLRSRQQAWWRVRVKVGEETSPWSHAAPVEAGLFEPTDWSAAFVSPVEDAEDQRPLPRIRHEFALAGAPRRARLYVTALGCYQAEINGRPVNDEYLAPGWTSYAHRVLVRTVDVTDLLQAGPNALGLTLGDGWYRGRLGWTGQRAYYGTRLAALVQLEVDGEIVAASGPAWRGSTDGPRRAADIYDGEDYDANRRQPGWSRPGFDDDGWAAVTLWSGDQPRLEPAAAPPVRIVERIVPRERWLTPAGTTIVDLGENIAGFLHLSLTGPAGARVTIRHAEVLRNDGALFTAALRSAKATDTVILDGGTLDYSPEFTFHGFRYAAIEASDPAVEVGEIAGLVISSDLPRTGGFACSDERVNRLQANIVRSQRGNFISVPTDCPQRDERLGWTGDINVFSPTASFTFDTSTFLGGWLGDVDADQRDDGGVPPFVPDVTWPDENRLVCAAWGDAAVMVPWALWEAYGDPSALARALPTMRRWVDYEAVQAGDDHLWTGQFQFGDWLDPDAPAGEPWRAKCRGSFVATAYLAQSASIVAESLRITGDPDAATAYEALAGEVRGALWETWHEAALQSQTGAALTLAFDLAPPAARPEVAAALDRLVAEAGDRLATGFVGTPLLCPILTSTGYVERAYRLLLQTEFPSWLYPVLRGATSIWERWDAIRPDGSIHGGDLNGTGNGMLSFNHYAYGAIGAWMYRTVAGLAPDLADPGYHHLIVAPRPGGGLRWARTSLMTRYGDAAVSWSADGGTMDLAVTVPANAWATISMPDGPVEVLEGRAGVRAAQDGATLTVGSGRYRLSGPSESTSR